MQPKIHITPSRIPHTRLRPLPRRPRRRRWVLLAPPPIAIHARAFPSPVLLLLLRPRRTHHGRGGHRLLAPARFPWAPAAADAAAEDGEEQEAADAGADADD